MKKVADAGREWGGADGGVYWVPRWKVEADGLTIAGFKPARAAKGGMILTMAVQETA